LKRNELTIKMTRHLFFTGTNGATKKRANETEQPRSLPRSHDDLYFKRNCANLPRLARQTHSRPGNRRRHHAFMIVSLIILAQRKQRGEK